MYFCNEQQEEKEIALAESHKGFPENSFQDEFTKQAFSGERLVVKPTKGSCLFIFKQDPLTGRQIDGHGDAHATVPITTPDLPVYVMNMGVWHLARHPRIIDRHPLEPGTIPGMA